jgi:[ribosomal protein S5]-alanine N-acetyltransferase
MIQLKTPRLLIQPLTRKQQILYLANNGSLEKELGLNYTPKKINEDLADSLENFFLPLITKHPEHHLFYTLWAMVLKEEQTLVGDLCFKGPPDETGKVEIGYGTYDAYQKQGLMTEGVAGLVHWCQNQPHIKTLTAETEAGNEASEKVLLRNHFTLDCQTRDNSWWIRKVSE